MILDKPDYSETRYRLKPSHYIFHYGDGGAGPGGLGWVEGDSGIYSNTWEHFMELKDLLLRLINPQRITRGARLKWS